MEKGKLGVRLCFYGVTAFILAILGYSTLLFLLLGVALLVEKDEWTSRQVIQAFCLCIISGLIHDIVNIFDFLYNIPFLGSAWSTIVSIINGVIGIAVFALCIVGILNNVKGKDANIPFAAKFADWAFGIITQKVSSQPVQNYQMPNQNFNPQYSNTTPQAPANGQFYQQSAPTQMPQAPVNGQFYQQSAPMQMPQQGESSANPASETNQNPQ